MNTEEIIEGIKKEIADILKIDTDMIDDDENFLKIGISSVQALKIINKMRKKLGVDINPAAMFEYKTIAQFAGYLNECIEEEAELEE